MINFYVKYINETVKSYAYSHMDRTKLRLDKSFQETMSLQHKVEASMFRRRNEEFIHLKLWIDSRRTNWN